MNHEEELSMVRLVLGVGINDMRGQCSYQNNEGLYQKSTFYKTWRNILVQCYGTNQYH